MRTWLLTSTTYGTWLPGSRHGSVTAVRDLRLDDPTVLVRVEHDVPGTPYEDAIPNLEESARTLMTGPVVMLNPEHAKVLLAQFHETARYRGWTLLAVSILFNHFHLVVQAEGDPEPEKLLGDFKSYGSRALTKQFGRPASETWWTKSGSKRKLPDDRAVSAAVIYVTEKQPNPLVVWRVDLGEPAP